ncbi:hypothetical protein Tco_0763186 [Tanacetum coccineum]
MEGGGRGNGSGRRGGGEEAWGRKDGLGGDRRDRGREEARGQQPHGGEGGPGERRGTRRGGGTARRGGGRRGGGEGGVRNGGGREERGGEGGEGGGGGEAGVGEGRGIGGWGKGDGGRVRGWGGEGGGREGGGEGGEGISSLSNEEIFEHLAHMGYVTNSESLTFFKGHFLPQWKFFIHIILHCLSSKKDGHGINSTMVMNLDSPHKFLLYPRFIQLLLNKQERLLLPHTRTYPTPILTSKLFSNMRRASKGYSGVVTPLFKNMLVQAQDEDHCNTLRFLQLLHHFIHYDTPPSLSPEPIQPTHEEEETTSIPHDSPLYAVHSHGSAKGSVQQYNLMVLVTKLNDRIDGLEKDLLQKILPNRGGRFLKFDEDPTVSLVQDEGIYWIPQEEKVHKKPNDETGVLVQEETPTEINKEHGSGEKGEIEISTANIQVSTASPPKVSTAVPHVYTRRSANDKGKAIMEEPATPKKVKKRTQVQLSMDEELARKLEEEERIMFNAEQEARALQEEAEERLNLEAARELQRQLDQRQDVPIQPTQTQGIDWNDPSVLRYHALKNKPVLIAQARRNMKKKYPLTKETLQKMVNWKLEAEAESSMAFELLKFIKTQIEDQ